tara:strand:+ start:848 stop:1117 length:270 start_codon:yes stop_codon:yes gene_type:complete
MDNLKLISIETEVQSNEQKIKFLKSDNSKFYEEIKLLKTSILEYTKRIEKNKIKIESICCHNWITETQMYERTVSCSICGKVNWNRSST